MSRKKSWRARYESNPGLALELGVSIRVMAAEREAGPGEVLRPHPAWRFKLPAIVKGGGVSGCK